MQDHFAVERTLDPPDIDSHPVLELQRADLVRDEPFARTRVEADQKRRHQEHQAADHDRAPFGYGRRAVAAGRFDLRVFGHQNACPIET